MRYSLVTFLLFLYGCGSTMSVPQKPIETIHGTTQQELARLTPPRSANFSFAVVGDTHCSNPEFGQHIAPLVASLNPNFSVFLGDETNTGLQSEFNSFFNALKVIPTPTLYIPGNHDYKTSPQILEQNLGNPSSYFFDYGAYRFVCLNNADGQFDEGVFLRNELKGHEARSFIFMHVPPSGVNSSWEFAYTTPDGLSHKTTMVTGSEEFLSICKEFLVTAVYSGHIHASDKVNKDGTTFILSGGGGGELDSFLGLNNIHHTAITDVSQYQVSYKVVQ